jgi:transcriptional regulator with XRE-family HTH domain
VAEPRIQVDGSKVKAARDAKGWSQETLAKKTGYKVSVIQKFEQGTFFSWPCLTRVADVLEVKEDDLIMTSPRPGGPYRFQKLLLELNKELLRDPDLWGVYDLDQEPHPTPDIRQGDRQQQGKLHAFAYMCLNVFQTVYAFYEAPRNRDVRGPL